MVQTFTGKAQTGEKILSVKTGITGRNLFNSQVVVKRNQRIFKKIIRPMMQAMIMGKYPMSNTDDAVLYFGLFAPRDRLVFGLVRGDAQ